MEPYISPAIGAMKRVIVNAFRKKPPAILSPTRAVQVLGYKKRTFTRQMTNVAIVSVLASKIAAIVAKIKASHTTYRETTGMKMERMLMTNAAIPRPLAIVQSLLSLAR